MDYMDEYDPDWAGDPKISTLKKIAFQVQRDIGVLKTSIATEINDRTNKDALTLEEIRMIRSHIAQIRKENNVSNLYFRDKISKEEAKRLWELYQSPDAENHRVADAAIEALTYEKIQGSISTSS